MSIAVECNNIELAQVLDLRPQIPSEQLYRDKKTVTSGVKNKVLSDVEKNNNT